MIIIIKSSNAYATYYRFTNLFPILLLFFVTFKFVCYLSAFLPHRFTAITPLHLCTFDAFSILAKHFHEFDLHIKSVNDCKYYVIVLVFKM